MAGTVPGDEMAVILHGRFYENAGWAGYQPWARRSERSQPLLFSFLLFSSSPLLLFSGQSGRTTISEEPAGTAIRDSFPPGHLIHTAVGSASFPITCTALLLDQ